MSFSSLDFSYDDGSKDRETNGSPLEPNQENKVNEEW